MRILERCCSISRYTLGISWPGSQRLATMFRNVRSTRTVGGVLFVLILFASPVGRKSLGIVLVLATAIHSRIQNIIHMLGYPIHDAFLPASNASTCPSVGFNFQTFQKRPISLSFEHHVGKIVFLLDF